MTPFCSSMPKACPTRPRATTHDHGIVGRLVSVDSLRSPQRLLAVIA